MTKVTEQDKGSKGDKTLTLNIGTPRGTFTAAFEKTAKVVDVIEAAIETKKLGGEPGDFEVFHGDQKLEPINRTLVSFGLNDGDQLLVTAQGEGV